MEPRASRPAARLRAVEALAEAGVPVGVNAAPLIPGLTDEELPAILRAAADAGATSAGYMLVRLPGAVAEVFEEWLRRTLPDRADRVLNRIREGKGGRLNDPRFGHRFRSAGPYAEAVRQVFRAEVRRLGLNRTRAPLATHHFRRLAGGQMDLF
jgi:DNA repair photolyase